MLMIKRNEAELTFTHTSSSWPYNETASTYQRPGAGYPNDAYKAR